MFSFIYKTSFDNGLTEHELDHVLLGISEDQPVINTDEVANWKWIDMDALAEDMSKNEKDYTVWFRIIFDRFSKHYKTLQNNEA